MTASAFDTAFAALAVAICESYNAMYTGDRKPAVGLWTPDMIVFKKSRGKYSKVFTPDHSGNEGHIWGFIVTDTAHAKFQYGDLLKAATWKAPAMNHARGNLFTGYSGVEWTGPTYCGTTAQAENVARAEMMEPINELAAIG